MLGVALISNFLRRGSKGFRMREVGVQIGNPRLPLCMATKFYPTNRFRKNQGSVFSLVKALSRNAPISLSTAVQTPTALTSANFGRISKPGKSPDAGSLHD